MVKDHSDSEKGNLLPPHRLLLSINSKGSLTARVLLYAPYHRQDNTYHGLCYTSHGALAGMRNSSMGINDTLNTFYLRLYGVRHMVKDHSDSKRGNPLPPHRLLLSINSKSSFICTIPQTGQHIPRPLLHQLWTTGWNGK